MAERRVLLTVSGKIPDDLDHLVESGQRPRADYVVMAEAFDADVADVGVALESAGRLGRLLHRIGGTGVLLGWYCFRHRRAYDVIVTDGEQVGLPLALLSRLLGKGNARHMMIVHILSTRAKSTLVRTTRLAGLIDRFVVYCSWQANFVETALGVASERVTLSPFMVDSNFFSPQLKPAGQRPMICSAGLERRDYPTLMAAVDGLDVDVVIAAASPWSTQSDSSEGHQVPDNVTIRRLNFVELRSLYAAASFVVMPLQEVEFQAGITTILEAMSMERPVLCTRTPGQTDTVIDGATGRYVEAGNPDALRSEIVSMLDEADDTTRLGVAARAWIIEHAEVERYAARLAADVQELRGIS